MLEGLTGRLSAVARRLQGLHRLSEENVSEALRDVRMALLEADVNIAVAKEFIAQARERALGVETIKGVHPGQQMVKIVYDLLVETLGGQSAELNISPRGVTVILMTGLQGGGKTTTTAKLAKLLVKQGYRPMMASTDVYRPAAIEQLRILGEKNGVPVFDSAGETDAVKIAQKAMAAPGGANVLLVDTAGRLHIDDTMMDELLRIRKIVEPDEILFVADAMTGQDAVTTAKAFNEKIGMTGVILTKLDGDTRGGVALSVKSVTGAPIKFVGVGEKIENFEKFHPDRVAGRILGMGDVLTLVERAQEKIDQTQAAAQTQKMLSATFDLGDFLEQLRMLKKMGPLDQLMKMIPGMGQAFKEADLDPDEINRTEAIISSMTLKERAQPGIINASRKRRISRGSGTRVAEVNRLLKNFLKTRKLMKNLGKMKKGGAMNPF
jgi:signal recognition particle subunit SRP54